MRKGQLLCVLLQTRKLSIVWLTRARSFCKPFMMSTKNGPTGPEAEFLRGELAGWRSTLYTEYHECAEQIVDRVRSQTGLTIPSCETRSGVAGAS